MSQGCVTLRALSRVWISIKRIIHPKLKILPSFTVPNLYEFLSSVKHKIIFFKTVGSLSVCRFTILLPFYRSAYQSICCFIVYSNGLKVLSSCLFVYLFNLFVLYRSFVLYHSIYFCIGLSLYPSVYLYQESFAFLVKNRICGKNVEFQLILIMFPYI